MRRHAIRRRHSRPNLSTLEQAANSVTGLGGKQQPRPAVVSGKKTKRSGGSKIVFDVANMGLPSRRSLDPE